MTDRTSSASSAQSFTAAASLADSQREWRLRQLIAHLPRGVQRSIHWLRKPSSRWARFPAGIGFCVGGVFWILPILGLWMLPVGLVLLSEDIPPLRRSTDRTLGWLESRMPHWFNHDKA